MLKVLWVLKMTNRISNEIKWLLNRFCKLDKNVLVDLDEIKCILKDLEYYEKYFTQNRTDYLLSIKKLARKDITIECRNHLINEIHNLIRTEIVVDFIIMRRTSWYSVKPLVNAFINAGCAVRIVPIPILQEIQDDFGKSLASIIKREGYEILDFHEYNVEEELPDIVIDNMAVDSAKLPEFRFLRIHNIVENTVHLEHSILTGYTEAMKVSHFRIARSRCWQYLVPSELFTKSLSMVFRIDGDFLTEGNPEIDVVVKGDSKRKNNHKKSVLWNIDALDPNEYKNGDAERIFREIEYIEKMSASFPSINNIVRTHPSMINQTKSLSIIEKLNCLVEEKNNVFLDKNILICDTYMECDAMVTWMSSTTLYTFMATSKPVAVMPTFIKDGYDTILDMNFLNNIEVFFDIKDVYNFFENLEQEIDLNKVMRIKTIKDYVKYIDGTASENIVRKVLEEYEKRR